jgi:hypothetical protein
MDRREFIKASIPAVALPAIAITCKYEDDEKGSNLDLPNENESIWDYRVYCYERGQGEWTFSQNIRGSFAYQREYMTFEEDQGRPYAGWMDQGKLHFASFDDAIDFVDCHVRVKDDTDLVDSIYDVYFVSRRSAVYDDAEQMVKDAEETEIKVAHYWFNGDTGRTVMWEQDGFNRQTGEGLTDWSKVECS